MTLKQVGIGATLVALVAAGWFGASALSDARAEVKLAQDSTKAALKQSVVAQADATKLGAQVVALGAQRDSALSRAVQKGRLASRLADQLVVLGEIAPDTCRPIVYTADSALAAKDSVIAQKDSALAVEQTIEKDLQSEADTLRTALIHLSVAAKTEVKAEVKLQHRSLLMRLLPTPGIGLAAGFNPAGAPQIITGVTLGWHLGN